MMLLASDTVSIPGSTPGVFVIAAPVVMTVVSLLIPLVTGLATKYTLPGWVKGFITILLNAIAAAIVTATQADGTAVFSNELLMTTVYGTIISVVAYLAVYKSAGLTSSAPDAKLAPRAGLGPSSPTGSGTV
jgi:small basic protein